jgi:hypothetical protein
MNVLNVKGDLEICYCSKDCYFDFDRKIDSVSNTGRIIFESGKGYEFFYEDENSIWVYYDKTGKPGSQGCRFWVNTKYGKLVGFDEYFNKIMLRKLKLEKLNRISDQSE